MVFGPLSFSPLDCVNIVNCLSLVGFVYYFYAVGLWGYLFRRLFPQLNTPRLPAREGDRDAAGRPGGPAVAPEGRLGAIRNLAQFPVVPRTAGPVKDVQALLVAFFCSLYPG